MKILIVENDSNKSDQVTGFLVEQLHISSDHIDVKKSYQSGLEAILTDSYEFLILDMSLPTFDITENDDGGETLDRGGEIILEEMEREGVFVKSVILTQYEEFDNVPLEDIDEALKNEFSDFYIGCIYYNVSEINWQIELEEVIQNLKK